ncbi:hypothetical protein [Tenacibaculum jejuense]|uniref:hypothetical protein n=1 Tax=Tenacibaculum jejuense TaxID=584609 RepID=UPI000BA4C7B5|nr:hypothetical protein [Tenacibaculum jejuense]
MKNKKTLKKLSLEKENFYVLGAEESQKIQGGLFKSRFICTQTKSDRGCTSHTRCTRKDKDGKNKQGFTILCID